jgi:TetR/AcrR family transcriptional repressor of nem operon
MKVSKTTASDNRNAIVEAASAQIRGRGFDQTSVAEVARAAGLTHGALYSHFQSKDVLTAEATKRAFEERACTWTGRTASEVLDEYLSTEHRDNPEQGCPTAALVSEMPRQPAGLQAAFRNGVDRVLALAGESLEAAGAEHGHDRAVLMFAAMVGGLAVSRAIRNVDEPSSAGILRAVGDQLRLLLHVRDERPHLPSRKDIPDTRHICFAKNLRSANRAIDKYYANYLRDTGLGPAQFTVLMHLHDLGEASVTKLAREMETGRTAMARNIRVLEQSGHVEMAGGEGRRARKIRMTGKGVAAFKRALPLWREAQRDLQHLLGQDLWADLTGTMRRLAAIEPPASGRPAEP